jgi:CubicO group peptidase (beta-lactamase class C family)
MVGHRSSIVVAGAALWFVFQSCKDSATAVDAFDPAALDDGWPVSTAEEQGLNRTVLEDGFAAAARLPYSYSLLVVRNGYLVAEQYFNGNSRDNANSAMSVSKSILSGLVGIALKEGYLDSLNQKALDFFPEYVSPSLDRRKSDITVRHLLMMRAGFDNDEATYSRIHTSTNWIKTTIDLPLLSNPGERMSYNTFETHLLSAILTEASHVSTSEFARKFLCEPLGITVSSWEKDPQGYFFGGNGMRLKPRDLAKFGYLYLRGGSMNGKQIIAKEWIDESLTNFTQWQDLTWGDVRRYNYGYLWWMGEISGYRVYFALGHGGQLVVNCPELDMLVVTTANPDFGWDAADEHERAMLHIVAQNVLQAVRR